jgi:hypothetical protein
VVKGGQVVEGKAAAPQGGLGGENGYDGHRGENKPAGF